MQVHRQQVRGILKAVAECAHFPDSSATPALDGGAEAATPEALEAEAAASERRQELFVLFRNAAKVAPEEGYAVVGGLLQQLVSPPSTGFQVPPSPGHAFFQGHPGMFDAILFWLCCDPLKP
jgi:hypothetical protein